MTTKLGFVLAYCVYKHTFPNGKVYIGITRQKPEDRWGSGGYKYLKKAKNNNYKQLYIANAILKYGWENVEHEILFEGLTKEEAEQKEVELIAKYQSNKREYGYNIEAGGNSVGKLSEETKRKIGKANSGKRMSDEQRERLRNIRKGSKVSEEQRRKIAKAQYGKNGSKPIRCIETNEIYDSIGYASRKTGCSVSKISAVCRGERKTAGGFHWEFVDESSRQIANENSSKLEYEKKINAKKAGSWNYKNVRCIETGVIYTSLKEASEQTGIHYVNISSVCRGITKTAGKYHWEFVNDDVETDGSIRCVETDVIYKSHCDAKKQTGINSSDILSVCKGNRKTAGGFHWEFVDDNLKKLADEKRIQIEQNKAKNKASRSKPVKCIETGIIYYGIREAGRQTDIDRSDIAKCCKGEQDNAGGYHWEYV